MRGKSTRYILLSIRKSSKFQAIRQWRRLSDILVLHDSVANDKLNLQRKQKQNDFVNHFRVNKFHRYISLINAP